VRQVLGDPLLDRSRGAMHTPESLAEERWRWRYRNHLIIVRWDGSDGQNQWCRGALIGILASLCGCCVKTWGASVTGREGRCNDRILRDEAARGKWLAPL